MTFFFENCKNYEIFFYVNSESFGGNCKYTATIVLNTARRIIEKREIFKTAEDKKFSYACNSQVRRTYVPRLCTIAGHGILKSDIQHFSLALGCSQK